MITSEPMTTPRLLRSFFTVLLAASASLPVSAWAAGPHIAFDKTLYDFGTTSRVERVTGRFTFRNTGDEPLRLETPATSCGCTEAKIEPESVEPGQEGAVLFTVTMPTARK